MIPIDDVTLSFIMKADFKSPHAEAKTEVLSCWVQCEKDVNIGAGTDSRAIAESSYGEDHPAVVYNNNAWKIRYYSIESADSTILDFFLISTTGQV